MAGRGEKHPALGPDGLGKSPKTGTNMIRMATHVAGKAIDAVGGIGKSAKSALLKAEKAKMAALMKQHLSTEEPIVAGGGKGARPAAMSTDSAGGADTSRGAAALVHASMPRCRALPLCSGMTRRPGTTTPSASPPPPPPPPPRSMPPRREAARSTRGNRRPRVALGMSNLFWQ